MGNTFNIIFGDQTCVQCVRPPSEIRRSNPPYDIIYELPFSVSDASFSRDGKYFFTIHDSGFTELRSAANSEDSYVLPRGVTDVSFSPHEKYFIVSYDNTSSEIRFFDNPAQVIRLKSKATNVTFSSNGEYFFINYLNSPGELLNSITFEPFIQLTRSDYDFVRLSPDGGYLIVKYIDAPGEIRRINSPADRIQLRDEIVEVNFSFDGSYFSVDYVSGSSELWSKDTQGKNLIQLTGDVDDINFSPDGVFFFVDYLSDVKSELWTTQNNLQRLAQLDEEPQQVIFSQDSKKLFTIYSDGRAYLLDPTWLHELNGDPQSLTPEKLIDLACQRTYGLGLIDIKELLRSYLGDYKPQACKEYVDSQ